MMVSETGLKVLTVGLEKRSYDIEIGHGLLKTAGARIAEFQKNPRLFVIYDERLTELHLDRLRAGLEDSELQEISVPSGEASKSWAQFQRLTEWLLSHRVERSDLVIAFGGGVIGDLAGFVAASTLRGLNFIQIPTTLLSQVDSSVGGKTGINSGVHGKNLIGAFHQPKKVLIDLGTLETLSARELRAGYAETVKYGLLGDAGFFDWLEAHGADVLAREDGPLTRAVAAACKAKADIVEADEQERSGLRSLLNLGHTFGHALEAAYGYDGRLLHGEGVSIGMCMAFDLSHRTGLISGQDVTRVKRHLEAVGLPVDLRALDSAPLSVESLMAAMAKDKKVEGGVPKFILVRGIGEAFQTKDVSLGDVEAVLTDYLKQS